jgi:hypothetical protein
VKPSSLLALLAELYRDKYALRRRHEAAVRHVSHYDFNNTYQYIIAREDVQLSWLQSAIKQMGGEVPEPPPVPEVHVTGKGPDALAGILQEDRGLMQAFVDRWRDRVETLDHARHRIMLRVVLGETLEHCRFFAQALAGRADLLGRRVDGGGTGGGVLPARWMD